VSSEELLFDPAVEEILREVASDPNSVLLRVPRASSVQVLLESNPIVRDRASLLSKAERELLRAHRAEVAHLLRQACMMHVYAGPEIEARRGLVRSVTKDTQVQIPTNAQWVASARGELELSRGLESEPVGIELLERCVADGSVERVSVAQLAAAAQRLHPTDHARIYAGLDLLHGGQLDSARRLFESVLEGCPRRIDAAYALTNLGYLHGAFGRGRRALEFYSRATVVDDTLELAVMNVLLMSVALGIREKALAASRRIDGDLTADHSAVTAMCSAVEFSVRAGALDSFENLESNVRWLSDRSGDATRRLVHALL